MHPATEAILAFFEYEHLPAHLKAASQPFCELAHDVAESKDMSGPEVTVCLRKLLESKDCAVRATIAKSKTSA